MPCKQKKLAVLVSGTGTLLESFLNEGLQVNLVLADRLCRGIDVVAEEKNVPTELVLRTDFSKSFNREAYTKLVLAPSIFEVSRCTVHIATPEVDEGKILAQKAVDILPDDTEESLHERIKRVERALYLETIRAFIADEL